MPLTDGQALREHRRQRGWTQEQCAAVLRVTPNTVARWERGEVRMPGWVSALVDVMAEAADHTQKAADGTRLLEGRVTALKAEVTTLKLRNLALEHLLRQRQRRRRQRQQRRVRTAPPHPPSLKAAEQVYKRLVRQYHPDRHPGLALVMADINELWQAMRRHRDT